MRITPKELKKLDDEQLAALQRGLDKYANKQLARQVNAMIYDEKDRRTPYGF